MSARVSVVVPVFNAPDLLAKVLAALQHQTYPRHLLEIIVADDGSDRTPIDEIQHWSGDLDARLVRQDRRGFRLASARNLGIRSARGDIIVSLDADMVASPGLVAAHVATVEARRTLVSIGPRLYVDASAVSAIEIMRDPTAIERSPLVPSASNWFMQEDRRTPELARLSTHPAPYNCMHGCNCAYWRATALRVGLYDEEFNGAWGYEDTEFAYRMWKHEAQFLFSMTAQAWHQENDVTSFDERVAGDATNFELACARIPGFREFKDRLREHERRPWW